MNAPTSARVAAGRERVRRLVGDHPQLRHRDVHPPAQLLHHRVDACDRRAGSPSGVTGCARYIDSAIFSEKK